jgi:hypothetical protein
MPRKFRSWREGNMHSETRLDLEPNPSELPKQRQVHRHP